MNNTQSDILTRALCTSVKGNTQQIVEASNIVEAENGSHEYHCPDCAAVGRHVRLKYVGETRRTLKFEQWDKITGAVLLDKQGTIKTKEKLLLIPPRFERWPGAEDHKCENSVRWQEFRSFAFRMNATTVGNYEHIFPILLPGTRLHSAEEARHGDLRKTFRPVGLGLSGIMNPKFFIDLAKFSRKDPGIESFQHFHDGLSLRNFNEVYFNKPVRLHDFLSLKKAWGRANSVLVAYQMDVNTSQQALDDPDTKGGFIDRSVVKGRDTGRIKLFARAMNGDTQRALFNTGLRYGKYASAPMIVMAEAYIPSERPHHVELEVFNTEQFCAWDEPYKFFPEQKAKGVTREATLAQQAVLAL